MRPFPTALLLIALLAPPSLATEAPEGFRGPPYRGRTPEQVPGAATASTDDVQRLHAAGAVLIDVTPLTLGTYGAMTDRWIVAAAHETLAGAIWLPNVGTRALSPRMDAWFRGQLTALTDGNPAHPLVFFCQADCWMSWNAAKRAALWRYTAVHWYRGGLDAWRLDLGPMAEGTPRPITAEDE